MVLSLKELRQRQKAIEKNNQFIILIISRTSFLY